MTARGVRLITVFGLGAMRPFPGTWGSLPPVGVALLAWAAFPPALFPAAHTLLMLALLLIFGVACVVQGDAAEARFGRKDPSHAVADEVAGQAVALLPLSWIGAGSALRTLGLLALAFLLFRLFDIAKPWPARSIQRTPGGWGILLDDLIAGAYAAVLLTIAAWAWPR